MKRNLSYESYLKSQGLSSIIREIVYVSDPEKILLLSASFEYLISESIYHKNAVQELTSKHYNLLILSNEKEKKSLVNNEMALNSRFKDRRNLQFLIMDIFKFNEDLKSGNEQANYILSNAMLWYDKEQVPLAFPNEGFN
jgi:hypothetical protein